MKKKFYGALALCALAVFSYNCAFDIEDNTRVLVKGTLVDSQGNPLQDILVSSKGDDNNLGSQLSQADGTFEYTSLESNRVYDIFINEQNFFSGSGVIGNTDFQQIKYSNVTASGSRKRDVYDLGTLTLFQRATLLLQINKTSSGNAVLQWELQFTDDRCSFVTNDSDILEESFCNETNEVDNVQNNDRPDFEQSYETLLDTEATFNYTIDNGPLQSIQIIINQENTDYVFEY